MGLIHSSSSVVKAINGTTNAYYFTQEIIMNGDQNITNNTSNITVNIYGEGKNASYGSVSAPKLNVSLYNSASNSASDIISNLTVRSIPKAKTLIGTWTGNITHADDGSLSISTLMNYAPNSTTYYLPRELAMSTGIIPLPTIPRKTPCPDFDAVIGTATSFILAPKSSVFTHTIRYTFGGASGTLTISDNKITLPSSLYAQIPNAKYGQGTIYVDTYNGTTLIGTADGILMARCNDANCKPTLTVALSDSNTTSSSLSGSTSASPVLIDYKSVALFSITAKTIKNNASFTSLTIDGISIGNVSSYSLTAPHSETHTVILTDSRGYSTTLIFQSTDSSGSNYFRRVAYIALTANFNFFRPSQTGDDMQLEYSGNFYKGTFKSGTSNTLTCKWRVKEVGGNYSAYQTLTPTISSNNNTYSNGANPLVISNPLVTGGAWDYSKEYIFEFYAIDLAIGTALQPIQNVTRGIPDFAVYANSSGGITLTVGGEVIFCPDS